MQKREEKPKEETEIRTSKKWKNTAAVSSFTNHKFRVDRIDLKTDKTGLGTGFIA